MVPTSISTSTDLEIVQVTPTSAGPLEFVDWLPAAVHPYWAPIANYPLLSALLIAAIFLIAAVLVRLVFIRSIGRFAENTETELDDRVIEQLKRPVFNVVFLFGLTLSAQAAQLPAGGETVNHILWSLIILTLMRNAFFVCGELLAALSRNTNRFPMVEARTIPLFDLLAKLMIMLIGSYALLMVWGINPVGWLASAGIVGIAVGFAAQDTIANLFAGFFILIDSPYKLRDYVNLDSGERGMVTHIGMRSTRLLTRDDVEITVPNSVMGNAKIINESGGPDEKMRIRIKVGVAYGSDVHEVERVLENVARAHEEVCDNPSPRVRMRGFGDFSLDFEMLGWIRRPEDRGRISHELYKNVYDALNANHMEIPFPKHDLYIKQMPVPTNGAIE